MFQLARLQPSPRFACCDHCLAVRATTPCNIVSPVPNPLSPFASLFGRRAAQMTLLVCHRDAGERADGPVVDPARSPSRAGCGPDAARLRPAWVLRRRPNGQCCPHRANLRARSLRTIVPRPLRPDLSWLTRADPHGERSRVNGRPRPDPRLCVQQATWPALIGQRSPPSASAGGQVRRPALSSIRLSSPARSCVGLGGHPGMWTSTGTTFATLPTQA